jgi:hypothetical protein
VSELDHPGRDIECLYLDTPVAKKDRVQPGSAIQFKDVMARFEDTLELLPDRMTPYLPYRRSGEPMLVGLCRSVPEVGCGFEKIGIERHGKPLEIVILRLFGFEVQGCQTIVILPTTFFLSPG